MDTTFSFDAPKRTVLRRARGRQSPGSRAIASPLARLRTVLFGALGLTIALTAAAGCRASQPPERSAGARASFTFHGNGGSSARVTISRAADGGETLHGETVLGARTPRCVVEDVTLDARGHLTRAEITVAPTCDGRPDQRLLLDRARGDVQATAAGATISRQAPTDAPWIYAPPSLLATPVSAWVVARAAASGAAAMRYLDGGEAAPLVPRDQVAVPTERGTTVVVGNDGADVDGTFIERVRMIDHGVTLLRAPKGGDPMTAGPAAQGGGRG